MTAYTKDPSTTLEPVKGKQHPFKLKALIRIAIVMLPAIAVLVAAGWLYYYFYATTIFRTSPATGMCWSPDGSQLAVAYGDGGVIIATYHDPGKSGWGTPRRSIRTLLPSRRAFLGKNTELALSYLSWSQDGRHIAGQCTDSIRVWDVSTLTEMASIPIQRAHGMQCRLTWSPPVAISSTGSASAVAEPVSKLAVTDQSNVLIWTPASATGKSMAEPAKFLLPHRKDLKTPLRISRGIWWSPDGTMLAVQDYPSVRILDVATGEMHILLTSAGAVDLAWSPDSTAIAAIRPRSIPGDTAGIPLPHCVQVWDLPTPQMQLLRREHWPILMSMPSQIFSLDPAGNTLALTSASVRWHSDGSRISTALLYEQFNGPPPEVHQYVWTYPEGACIAGGIQPYQGSAWRIPNTLRDLGKLSFTMALWNPCADRLALMRFHALYWQPEISFGCCSTVTVQPSPAQGTSVREADPKIVASK